MTQPRTTEHPRSLLFFLFPMLLSAQTSLAIRLQTMRTTMPVQSARHICDQHRFNISHSEARIDSTVAVVEDPSR